MDSDVGYLTFRGVVRRGAGRFARELGIPGADEISVPIRDWPERVHPGTLNVRVKHFPAEFRAVFGDENVRLLDNRLFAPEAELLHSEIGNNTLPPTHERPDRGNAQIWRAILKTEKSEEEGLCWVLRRIGSGLSIDLECVAAEHLRSGLGLSDGDSVSLTVEGRWKTRDNTGVRGGHGS